MDIHLSIHPSREGWVSFETDPRLTRTKERLHGRCLPCLTSLLEQLKGDPREIALGPAWECWKIVAVVESREEGLELLERFSESHPGQYVYGKMGTGRGRDTVAVMFHTEDAARKDELHRMLREVVGRHFPGRRVFTSRACGDPYERLLGPWQEWAEKSPVRYPEQVARVRADLREALYGRR